MIEFYKDKSNHPMFGKTHNKEALALISKPGELNPIFLRVRKGPKGPKAYLFLKMQHLLGPSDPGEKINKYFFFKQGLFFSPRDPSSKAPQKGEQENE